MREFPAMAVRSVLLLTACSYPVLAWTSTSGLPLSLRRFSSHHSCCVSPSPVRGGSSSSSSSLCSTSIHLATRPKGLNGRQVPTCKLERLPRRTLKRAVPVRPTAERWVAYFGQTATERRRRVVDALAVAFVFYWTAFFASRTLLGALVWRVFYLVVFIQGFLRPLVESRSRALELWGAGNTEARSKTKGALFTGRVTQTGFALASEASDHRTHFQMLVEDEEGRELLFDVPQVAEYRDVREGMRCEVVVLTRSAGFSELTGITEAYLPELEMFVGRFPFLDKRVFGELLDSRDERDRRGGGTAAALPALSAREKRPGQDGRRGVKSSRDDDIVGRGNDLDVSQLRRQRQERGGRERLMAVESNEKGWVVPRRARIR